jgi:hypothetical protein
VSDTYIGSDKYKYYRDTILETEGGENGIPYSTFYYKGYQAEGTCAEWQQYTATQLIMPYDNIFFSQAQFVSHTYDYDTETAANEVAVCDNAVQVEEMIDALETGLSYEFNCDGRSWRIFTCNGYRVMCLDCKESCVETEACTGYSHIINPCMDNPVCTNRHASGQTVSFAYSFVPYYPFFVGGFNLTATTGQIYVSVNVSKAGTLSCGAFVTGTSFSSITKISEQGFSAYMSGAEFTTVLITGLGPDTDYDVYCFTEDYANHMMPLDVAVENMQTVRTGCCRSALFDLSDPVPKIAEITTATTNPEYSFTLSSQPTDILYVYLTLTSFSCADGSIGTSPYSSLTAVSPNRFNFTGALSESLTGFFTVRGYQGCYELALSVESPGGNDTYANDTAEITIINMYNIEPETPQLTSIKYTSDGLGILFTFDTPTNMPTFDNSTIFECINIVDFLGSDSDGADCKWISSTVLRASLAYTVGFKPSPTNGDTGTINANIVQAECTISDCSDYAYVQSTLLTIAVPDDAQAPDVSLSSSTSVGSCDDIILDPTGSSGAGGRTWHTVLWTVADADTNNPNNTIAEPVETYLNAIYGDGDTLATIPNEYLTEGYTYAISLTLTNFLTTSSTSSVSVEVTTSSNTPQLSIAGPASLVKYRNQSINLFAVASIPTCAGSVANLGISYDWKVYRGSVYESTITSTSLDPRYFIIEPFVLSGSTDYVIQVTATGYSETNINPPISYYNVIVQIGQAGVESIIEGGEYQTVGASEGIVLDGSFSSDLDASDASSSDLTYAWTCLIYDPEYGYGCEGFPTDSSSSTLSIPANSMPSGKTYQISLIVTNEYDLTSTSTVQLRVVASSIPSVSMELADAKYNRDEKVVLTGAIVATSGVNAYWSVDGLDSGTAIEDIVATATTSTILTGTTIVQLSVMKDMLTEGLAYTFYLNAAYSDSTSSDTSTASVVVNINEAPSGGSLTVDPTVGTAMNTSFVFQTAGWSDDPDDYPLQFLFSYYVYRADVQITVKSKSELSYSSVYLGQGSSSNGQVTCVANASDAYGATGTTSNTDVKIIALSSVQDVLDVATSKIARAYTFADPTAVGQALTGIAQTLNAVDCSVPTVCSTLFREDCTYTRKTCGPCYSGYIGVEGDSNTQCGATTRADAAAMSSRRLTEMTQMFKKTRRLISHIYPDEVYKQRGLNEYEVNVIQGQVLDEELSWHTSTYMRHRTPSTIEMERLDRNGNHDDKRLSLVEGDDSIAKHTLFSRYNPFNAHLLDKDGILSTNIVRRRVSSVSSVESMHALSGSGDTSTGSNHSALASSMLTHDPHHQRALRRLQLEDKVHAIHRRLSTVYKMIPSGDACNSVSTSSACISGTCTVDSGETIGVCAYLSKSCPNDCDNSGTCIYKDRDGNTITDCPKNDIFCRAECSCDSGRYGLDCSVETSELSTTKDLRDDVCFNLQTVQAIQNENDDVLLSRAQLIADTIWDPSQINDDAFEVCVNMLVDTVRTYPDIAGSTTHYDTFSNAFSNILNKREGLSTDLVANVTAGLQLLAEGIQHNLAIGETELSITMDNLRMMTVVLSPDDLSASSFSIPRSDYEAFDNSPSEPVIFDASSLEGTGGTSDGTVIGVVIEQLVNNPEELASNSSVVTLRTIEYTASSSGRRKLTANERKRKRELRKRRRLAASVTQQHRRLDTYSDVEVTTIGTTLTIQNKETITYTEVPVSTMDIQCYRTTSGAAYQESLTCPTGHTQSYTCPGTKGTFTVTCPSYKDQPECQLLNTTTNTFVTNPLCGVTAYNSTATTCECVAGDFYDSTTWYTGSNSGSSGSSDSSSSSNSSRRSLLGGVDDGYMAMQHRYHMRDMPSPEDSSGNVNEFTKVRDAYTGIITSVDSDESYLDESLSKYEAGINPYRLKRYAHLSAYARSVPGLRKTSKASRKLTSHFSVATDGDDGQENIYASNMIVTTTLFSDVFTAAPPILERGTDTTIFVCLMTFVGLFVILLVYLFRQDTMELQKARKTRLTDKKMVRTAGDFFGSLLPPEFEDGKWYDLLYRRVLLEHSWVSLFHTYQDERDYRVVKLCVAFNQILVIMFWACIMSYSAYGPDDGSCELNNFQTPCITQVTSAGVRNECEWLTDNDSCGYATPILDALAIIAYSIFISLFSLPIAKIMEWMAKCILKTKAEVIASGKSPFFWSIKEKKRLASGGSVVPVDDDGDVEVYSDDDSDDDTIVREKKQKRRELFENTGDVIGNKYEDKVGHDGKARGKKSITDVLAEKKEREGEAAAIALVKAGNNGEDGPVSPLRDGEAPELQLEYWEVCDELTDSQTMSSKWLRAARLRKLQEYADFALPMMEVEMLIALNNHELEYYGRQLLVTDPKNVRLLYRSPTIRRARYAGFMPFKSMICNKIVAARTQMEYLKEEIEVMPNKQEQEIFLMKHFLIDNLQSYRRNIASRYLLGEGRFTSPHLEWLYKACQYSSCVLLPLLWGILIYFIMVYNISIGSRATGLWLAISLSTILIDAFVLQPVRIWFRWIAINSTVASDVRMMISSLAKRYVSIIQRKAGIMRDANSLIQHFNPACRVARQFPHLPISRFLLSLNDYDVPHYNDNTTPLHLKRGKAYYFALVMASISGFLAFTTWMIPPLQDMTTELACSFMFHCLLIVLYYIGAGASPVLAILISIGIIGVVVSREWWLGILARRRERRMARRVQDESFLKYQLSGANKQIAGVTKDEYLSDEYIGQNIDDTAQFASKFKPAKGAIKEKYLPSNSSTSVVPMNTNIIDNGGMLGIGEHSQVFAENSISNSILQQPQAGGGMYKQFGEDSGVGVANHDDFGTQAQPTIAPISIKQYGGAGAFGVSRRLDPLPPRNSRPPDQQQIADQIALLEKNITANLETIIKSSIKQSSLHSKRKGHRRKQLRAISGNGAVLPADGDMDTGLDELDRPLDSPTKQKGGGNSGSGNSSRRNSRRSRRKKGQEGYGSNLNAPGLSARGLGGYGVGTDNDGRPDSSGNNNTMDAQPDFNFIEGFEEGTSPRRQIGGNDIHQGGDLDTMGMYDASAKSTTQQMMSNPSSPQRRIDPNDVEDRANYVDEAKVKKDKMLGVGSGIAEAQSGKRTADFGTAPKFGEDPNKIERKQKIKVKPQVEAQFPSWH